MDYALSFAAVGVASQSFGREIFVKFFADWSGYVLLGIALLWILYDFMQKKISRKNAVVLFLQMGIAAFLSRGIITEVIRHFWHRARPFALGQATQLFSQETSYSFPSGHAAFYFAIAMVLYSYNKKLGILAFAVSIAMGIARVFAGYHWPSDIVGGVAVGAISGFLVVKFFRLIGGQTKKLYVEKS